MTSLNTIYLKKIRLNLMNRLVKTNNLSMLNWTKMIIFMGLNSEIFLKTHLITLKNTFLLSVNHVPKCSYSTEAVAEFKLKKHQLLGYSLNIFSSEIFYILEKFVIFYSYRTGVIIKVENSSTLDFKNNLFKKNNAKKQWSTISFGVRHLNHFPEIENSLYQSQNLFKGQGISITLKFDSRNDRSCYLVLSHLGFLVE